MTVSETTADAPGGRMWRWLIAVSATGVLSALLWFARHSLRGAHRNFILLVAIWLTGAWAAHRPPVGMSLLPVVAVAVLLRLGAATGTTPSISNDLVRMAELAGESL